MYKGIAGVCFATLLFVCSATGFPNLPGSAPPSNGTVAMSSNGVSTAQFASGANVTLTGGGYVGNGNLTVGGYSSPVQLATATADPNGNFSITFALPSGFTGTHTIAVVGNDPALNSRVLEARITVTVPAAVNQLARTGFSIARWTMAGTALLLLGFVLVRTVAFRRRLMPAR